jgi:hypothetical protein
MSTEGRAETEGGQGAPDQEIVAELYKYGGAFALIGLEFLYQANDELQPSRARLEGMLENGESYRAMNVRILRPLKDAVSPKELTVGLKSRGARDPVIKLMRQLKMPTEPFIDPLMERPPSGMGEYRTPEEELGTGREGYRGAAPSPFGERGRRPSGGMMGRGYGERVATPLRRAPYSPLMQQSVPRFGAPVGQGFQQGFRPVPVRNFNPPVHAGGGYGCMQPPYKGEDEMGQAPVGGLRGAQMAGFGRASPASPMWSQIHEGRSRTDPLEAQIAAIEESRQMERTRMAMSSELRRMQSGVSPFEHPGVYSHIDQMVTMHELPRTWGGPLTVAGTSGNVLIADHVKLAFLAEAIWEFTKRKCAEGGEVLTEKRVQEIEAQTLEFYGKQRVEAKRFLEKAGLSKGKGNK